MEVEHLLNGAPDIHETAVYGVRVPGTDGRAGMVLVVPGPGKRFDPDAFHAWSQACLPPYARPLFARVARHVDITGNFKNRKIRLQSEGFDPVLVGADGLWFRDDQAGTFVPLGPDLYDEITAGKRRL